VIKIVCRQKVLDFKGVAAKKRLRTAALDHGFSPKVIQLLRFENQYFIINTQVRSNLCKSNVDCFI
jgi:PP-loop superfamily ATP-utilizing enzyme